MNQVVLQLVVERQAGIPLLMQTLDGNNSDNVSFRERVEQFIQQMQAGFGAEYLVADSALYTAENLQTIDRLGWISRVPESLAQAQTVILEFSSRVVAEEDARQQFLAAQLRGKRERGLQTLAELDALNALDS